LDFVIFNLADWRQSGSVGTYGHGDLVWTMWQMDGP